MTMPYLTISQGGPGATRAEVVAEWQNMVLGGKHGRHKDWCSMCRNLDIPNLLSPYTDFSRFDILQRRQDQKPL
jgi:hypothetical protein